MLKKTFIFLSALIIVLFMISNGVFADTVQLPQTGQTKCYDTNGNEIACAGTGQDGEIRAGVAWPNPRFTVSGNCVTDNLTGLMWSRDGNPSLMTWYKALDYTNNLNLCGYSDWHLPNINELYSLLNSELYSDNGYWLSKNGFENINNDYWSSTTTTTYPDSVFELSLADGYMDLNGKFYLSSVLPVRIANQNAISEIWRTGQTLSYYSGDDGALQQGAILPIPRFINNADGTVTDNLTGLMWLRDADCFGLETNWQNALNKVTDFNINPSLYNCNNYTAKYNDWRMPNITELISILDHSQYPALPLNHPFVNVNSKIWSSTSIPKTDSASVVSQ